MPDQDYIKIAWPDVQAGDVLMHANGDRVTVKSVGKFYSEPVVFATVDLALIPTASSWARGGFSPYRPVEQEPELPTEPGAYLGRDGEPWLLSRDGRWWDWTTMYDVREWKSDISVSKYGPFTRLVPMPTEEQVREKMHDAIFGRLCTDPTVDRAVAAVMALFEQEADSE